MKKLLILLFCCLAITANAYTVLDAATGTIQETNTLPTVTRTVEKLSNGTKVTYEFSGVLLMADPLKSETYYPLIEGFGQTATEKEAWLPVRNDRFMLTDSTGCNVSILSDETVTVRILMSPARADHAETEDFEYTSSNLPIITSRPKFLPEQIAFDQGCEIYRGYFIKSVQIHPIQYNSITRRARFHKKFSYA